MLIKKTAFALLCVTYVSARNKFIDNFKEKERAEIFQRTDSDVPIIHIKIPDDEYEQLKREGSIGVNPSQGNWQQQQQQPVSQWQQWSQWQQGVPVPAVPFPGGAPPPPPGPPPAGVFPQQPQPQYRQHRQYTQTTQQTKTEGTLYDYETSNSSYPKQQGNYPNQQIANYQKSNARYIQPQSGAVYPYTVNPQTDNSTSEKLQKRQFPMPVQGQPMPVQGQPIPVTTTQEAFTTKNATMTFEINNERISFDQVTLKLGGNSSRVFAKQGYNIKIRGDKDLFGRSQFRIRPDAREATYLRSKLACDIHNRLNLPSISANYAQLLINNDYMGLYILMDAVKLSWVEYEYGEKDSTHLYQCKEMNNMLTYESSYQNCENENEKVTDNTEWYEFLKRLDAANSAEDIEDILDIDQFLYEMAYEYLAGSWDHYLNYGHNFSMYKPPNGKWQIILYDFDGEFGQDIAMGARSNLQKDYASFTFSEWAKPRHLIDILILNNSTRFDNIVRDVVDRAFNPTLLFPYINKLKEFIRPYVKFDKTQDENGKYPGRLNEKIGDYSINQWEANTEFTTIQTSQGSIAYGLKYWILMKYRYVCGAYKMKCDETYLNENYKYFVDTEVEKSIFSRYPNQAQPEQPPQNPQYYPEEMPSSEIDDEPEEQYKCWAEYIGSTCCPEGTQVFYSDADGEWGFDFEANDWCGLSPFQQPVEDEWCWSDVYGVPCCRRCKVTYEDSDGKWGFENNEWCGIQSYCPLDLKKSSK